MTILDTENVTFEIATIGTPDDFGETQVTYNDVQVRGCLVQPGFPTAGGSSAGNLSVGFELNNLSYLTIHIPKTFKLNLANSKARLRGRDYKTISTPDEYTSTPGPWDRFVVVEAVS